MSSGTPSLQDIRYNVQSKEGARSSILGPKISQVFAMLENFSV